MKKSDYRKGNEIMINYYNKIGVKLNEHQFEDLDIVRIETLLSIKNNIEHFTIEVTIGHSAPIADVEKFFNIMEQDILPGYMKSFYNTKDFRVELFDESGETQDIVRVFDNKKIQNEYRFYIYDFLIGQQLLTIDTVKNRARIDRLNIYGQCYSFGDKWDKITKATINRALRRSGYVYDEYIKEHFTDREKRLKDKVLFKSNDYNECIKFIARFGKEKGHEKNVDYDNYFKKYLDIPENEIGKILEDGAVKKEYFQEGHIYKNICNFYRQDGICYISEGQADKIDKNSKPGEDYETYQTIFEKVQEAYKHSKIDENKYSIKDFTETIFHDLNWQSPDALIIDSIDALDDEYFLDKDNELEE